jgi:glycosyltransferase involved in cell wall biosynthesis
MTLEIMMPFYGRFDHLKLAVNSVLGQSDPDWRLTVVDDVYPDLSPGQWVAGLDDSRITYLRNETNLRPSRNYNKCVSLAESEFMVLMGCDDVMLPNYVSRVKELIERFPHASIIQPGVSVIDGNGNHSLPLADRVKSIYRVRGRGPRSLAGEKLATSLLRGNWTYFPSICWRTSDLRKHEFRTDLDVVQDLAMLLEIATDGGVLVLDDEIAFNYRRHAASLSSVTGTDGSKFAQERVLFGEAEGKSMTLGWSRAARAARAHLTSRLNALSELPGTIRHGNRAGSRALVRHIAGGSSERS